MLRRIRADSRICSIPVVVLSTTANEEDVMASYQMGARSFITKPAELDRFFEIMKTLRSYWFDAVALPPVHDRRR